MILLFTISTGDNYYENENSFFSELAIQIISALFGFIGAYLIFQFGIKKERKANALVEEKRLKDLLSFVKVSLQTNIAPIINQIEDFKYLIEQLKSETVTDIKLNVATSLDFVEWMKSVDMKELQKAVYLYYPGKDRHIQYGVFIKHLLHLKNITFHLEEDFLNITRQSNKFETLFNEGKAHIFERIEISRKTLIEAQNRHMHVEEIQIAEAVDLFFKEQNEVKRNDMFFTYNILIKPLIAVAKLTRDPILIKGIRLCDFAFESYKKNQLINQNKFENYKQGLQGAIDYFPAFISELEKIPAVTEKV
jgi:hypothetical protein